MSKKRTSIKGILKNETLGLEVFQNSVLRPIIKAQHDLLILIFQQYFNKRKVDLGNLTKMERESIIKNSLTKDISFKNQVIGMIVGHFEKVEYLTYQEKASEFNKRITQIVIQRMNDSFIELL